MFCGCSLSFGDPPNTHTCPVCLAHPGALPVVNQRAVEFATRIALALGCSVPPRNVFHRKNYFYPDSPKAYQISQYDEPLAVDGSFNYWVGDETRTLPHQPGAHGGGRGQARAHRRERPHRRLRVLRRRLQPRRHAARGDRHRAGHPLARRGARVPQPARATVIELGVSDCNMEEGQVRWDANISVRPAGSSRLGMRTELKNMNSFRFLQQALESRSRARSAILEGGGRIDQETLHFDPDTGTTSPLRSKEEAHDYRYFPEPDLVPLSLDPAWVEEVRAALPELPAARVERFMRQYALSRYDAFILGDAGPLARFYEAAWPPARSPRRRPTGPWASTLPTPTRRASSRAGLRDGGPAGRSGAAGHGGHRLRQRRQRPAQAHDRGTRRTGGGGREARVGADQRRGRPAADGRRGRGRQPRRSSRLPGRQGAALGFFVGQAMKATSGAPTPGW